MMRCPRCGESDYTPIGNPKTKDDAILARHRCQRCSLVFMSIQMPVTGKLAAQLVELLDL